MPITVACRSSAIVRPMMLIPPFQMTISATPVNARNGSNHQ